MNKETDKNEKEKVPNKKAYNPNKKKLFGFNNIYGVILVFMILSWTIMIYFETANTEAQSIGEDYICTHEVRCYAHPHITSCLWEYKGDYGTYSSGTCLEKTLKVIIEYDELCLRIKEVSKPDYARLCQ